MTRLCPLPLAAMLLAGRAASAETSTDAVSSLREIQLTHGGLQRRYLIHIPPGLDSARPAPLVLAFYGGVGHAEYMADDTRYGLVGEADRAGATSASSRFAGQTLQIPLRF